MRWWPVLPLLLLAVAVAGAGDAAPVCTRPSAAEAIVGSPEACRSPLRRPLGVTEVSRRTTSEFGAVKFSWYRVC
jgi:hypothetical protein